MGARLCWNSADRRTSTPDLKKTSALASLEPGVLLVDHVNASTTADNAAIFIPRLSGF
jgi:hypothetical protein